MDIKCLKEFDLGIKLKQVRSVPVSLGKDMPEAVLFVYSSQGNLDHGRRCLTIQQIH
jgi:hypothetical protein